MNQLAPIATKLGKLIPMLSSDKDGEVVAAARAIGRALNGAGLDYHVLAAAVTTPPVPVYPTFKPAAPARPHWKSAAGSHDPARLQHLAHALFCESLSHRLRANEADFIASMIERLSAGRSATEKQAAWLDAIYRRLTGRGR